MENSPDSTLSVHTVRVSESGGVWIWTIIDNRTGEAIADSWSNEGVRFDTSDAAQSAGRTYVAQFASAVDRAQGLLMLVPRARDVLYQSLKRSYADSAKIQVLLDRRFNDRRTGSSLYEPDRRRADRRQRTDIDGQLKDGRAVTIAMATGQPDFRDPDERAILFLFCSEHVVACQQCHNTHRLRRIERSEARPFACPLCGFDLTSAVIQHTRTCWYWVTRSSMKKPLATVDTRRPADERAAG
jgi:hypothetical protein